MSNSGFTNITNSTGKSTKVHDPLTQISHLSLDARQIV